MEIDILNKYFFFEKKNCSRKKNFIKVMEFENKIKILKF